MDLVIVVTGDYGELGGALFFVQGLSTDTRPVLLVPTGLRAALPQHDRCEVRCYGTLQELSDALDLMSPRTVAFFSAYLLMFAVPHADVLGQMRILRNLRRRSARVWTSDPFIGLLRSPWSLRLEDLLRPRMPQRPGLRVALGARMLAARLFAVARLLRTALHLYPASIAPARPPATLRWAHYNSPEQPPAGSGAVALGDRCWMFVLARADLDLQQRLHGAALPNLVAHRLLDATRAGRRALLVAPPSLLASVSPLVEHQAGVELLETPTYVAYMARLMDAEYAFFWNYYSFSILHRALAVQPVFFFDAGHMEHVLAPLADAGIACFYLGWRPPLLDMHTPLDAPSLSAAALAAQSQLQRISLALSQGRSPADLLSGTAGLSG